MAGPKQKKNFIDGTSLLYPYLQHELQQSDVWLFQMLVSRLIVSLGVWLSPDAYRVLPIAVPFAFRHPLARGNKKRGIPDQWGAPTSDGYLMDDNSLVKNLVKALFITSPSKLLNGKYIAKGYVASHVWQRTEQGDLSARDPLTYSFVPNLLWLPSDVSKLSDRAGFTQSFMQALAVKIYRDVEVARGGGELVEQAWDRLRDPGSIPVQALPAGPDPTQGGRIRSRPAGRVAAGAQSGGTPNSSSTSA